MEQRVEAVDEAAVADGEAQLDHLLRVEVCTELTEELVGDRCHARAGLREAHDRGFVGAVNTFGQRIVAEMRYLFVGEPYVSTETDVGRYSIVAVVGDRSGQIRELSLVGTDVRGGRRLGARVEE